MLFLRTGEAMPAKKIILLVDDEALIHLIAQDVALELSITLLSAKTLEEAQCLLNKYQHKLDAILLDGKLTPGFGCDTLPLISFLKEQGFDKPLVAISSSFDMRMEMVHRGCSHQFDKWRLSEKLAGLLSI